MKIPLALHLWPCFVVGCLNAVPPALASVTEPSTSSTAIFTVPLPPAPPMAKAAQAFLDSLTEDQRKIALRPLNDPDRTGWHYVPMEDRKGLPLLQMTEPQRALARDLLRASLSDDGFRKASTVMELEKVIRHYEHSNSLRDPLRYHFTLFGEPSESGRWGLSVEGHHLSFNFLLDGRRLISATPLFVGANPAEVREAVEGAPPPGTRVLAQEEELARNLLKSLSAEQRARAVVADESPMDMREGNRAQTRTTGPVGLAGSELSPEQKQILFSLMGTGPRYMTPESSRIHAEHLKGQLDQTTFAWLGSTEPGQPHSVRILGPTLLVLLFKTQHDSAGNPANHTHLLWRTPGKDFGEGITPEAHTSESETRPASPPEAPAVLLPAGVTTTRSPRVEWRGGEHKAFQVLVTEGPETSSSLLWDSGPVASDANFLPATEDLPLSATLYAHVRLQNDHGWGSWSSERAAIFRIEPLPTPAGILHHYSLRHTRELSPVQAWDEIHLTVALQGIVNRDEPRLWIDYVDSVDTGQNIDAYWLARLREPNAWLSRKALLPVTSLSSLLSNYRDRVRGLVVWDPEVPATALVASTVAGADDLLPVRFDPSPESLYSRLTSGEIALPVVVDLVGKFPGSGTIPGTSRTSTGSRKCDAYLWAAEHYLKTGRCNPRAMGYYIDAYWLAHPHRSRFIQNHTLTNHDYFIAQRGFFWDLSPWADEAPVDDTTQPLGTDLATLREILQTAYDRLDGREFIHVGGFTPWMFKYTNSDSAGGRHDPVQTEWETVRVLSAYNAYVDADALDLSALANASVMSQMPLPRRYVQPPAPTREDLERSGLLDKNGKPAPRTYLLHYVGDYDSAAWVGNSLIARWDAPDRGSVTVPWAVNPNLMRRIAPFFEYAYRTRTAQDHFMAGDSGAGYVNPTQLLPPRDPSALPGAGEAWQRHCRPFYQQFDYSFTGFLINGRAGLISPQTEQLYLSFSPNGIVNQSHLSHAPVHVEAGRLPAFVMNADLGGDLDVDLATVHGAVETTPPGQARFLVFRTILQNVSYLAALNARLTETRPGLDYTFCDPRTFGYLARAALGGHNFDLPTCLFETAPDSLISGQEYEFEVALRNDGWNPWRAQAADEPGPHLAVNMFSSAEKTSTEPVAQVKLPHDVTPGNSAVITVRIKAPSDPGEYILSLALSPNTPRNPAPSASVYSRPLRVRSMQASNQ